MGNEERTLLSTGALARRTNRSQSLIRLLVSSGEISPPLVLDGSGRHVWPAAMVPEVERALARRAERSRGGRQKRSEAAVA